MSAPFKPSLTNITEEKIDAIARAILDHDAGQGPVPAIDAICDWPPDAERQEIVDAFLALQDRLLERTAQLAHPAVVASVNQAVREFLGADDRRDAVPRWDTPSWEIFHEQNGPDDTATEAEARRARDRARKNLVWFVRHPKAAYTVDEAAELLAVKPTEVHELMLQRFAGNVDAPFDQFVPDLAAGRYQRAHIAILATERGTWDEDDLLWAINEGGAQDPWHATNDVPTAQLEALRKFFTEPKKRYSRDEVQTLFGKYLDSPDTLRVDEPPVKSHHWLEEYQEDGAYTRQTVGQFLMGYVSQVVIGRAVAGLRPSPLSLRTITVSLPAWQIDALERLANDLQDTVSDVLAMELESGLSVGFSAKFDRAFEAAGGAPDYGTTHLGALPDFEFAIPNDESSTPSDAPASGPERLAAVLAAQRERIPPLIAGPQKFVTAEETLMIGMDGGRDPRPGDLVLIEEKEGGRWNWVREFIEVEVIEPDGSIAGKLLSRCVGTDAGRSTTTPGTPAKLSLSSIATDEVIVRAVVTSEPANFRELWREYRAERKRER